MLSGLIGLFIVGGALFPSAVITVQEAPPNIRSQDLTSPQEEATIEPPAAETPAKGATAPPKAAEKPKTEKPAKAKPAAEPPAETKPKADSKPKSVPLTAATAAVGETRYVTASALSLRAEPTTKSDRIASARKGEAVTLLDDKGELIPFTSEGIEGHWVHVQFGDKTGYAFDGFLSAHAPEKAAAAPTATEPVVATPAVTPPTPAAPAKKATAEDICIPGQRVGSITRDTTYDALVETFGLENLTQAEVDLGGGDRTQGTAVFANSPRGVQILWAKELVQPKCVIISRPDSTWHTPENVAVGAPLSALVKLNGAPISFAGFDGASPGTVVDWNGGALEDSYAVGEKCVLTLVPTDGYPSDELLALQSDGPFKSDEPVVRTEKIVVAKMVILLKPEASKAGGLFKIAAPAPVKPQPTTIEEPKPEPAKPADPVAPAPSKPADAAKPEKPTVEEAQTVPAPSTLKELIPTPAMIVGQKPLSETPPEQPAPEPPAEAKAVAKAKVDTPEAKPVKQPAPASTAGVLYTMASSLNLRATPARDAAIVTKIPYGTTVATVNDSTPAVPLEAENMHGRWIKVAHEGKEGYVFNAYVVPLPAPDSSGGGLQGYAESKLGKQGEPVVEKRGEGGDEIQVLQQTLGHDAQVETRTSPAAPEKGKMTSLILSGVSVEQAFVLARRCEKTFADAPFTANAEGGVIAQKDGAVLRVQPESNGRVRISITQP